MLKPPTTSKGRADNAKADRERRTNANSTYKCTKKSAKKTYKNKSKRRSHD